MSVKDHILKARHFVAEVCGLGSWEDPKIFEFDQQLLAATPYKLTFNETPPHQYLSRGTCFYLPNMGEQFAEDRVFLENELCVTIGHLMSNPTAFLTLNDTFGNFSVLEDRLRYIENFNNRPLALNIFK